jgi:hypothetical protein
MRERTERRKQMTTGQVSSVFFFLLLSALCARMKKEDRRRRVCHVDGSSPLGKTSLLDMYTHTCIRPYSHSFINQSSSIEEEYEEK